MKVYENGIEASDDGSEVNVQVEAEWTLLQALEAGGEVAEMYLTPAEARALAARLIACAEEIEAAAITVVDEVVK